MTDDNIFVKMKAIVREMRVQEHVAEQRQKERDQGIHRIDELIDDLEVALHKKKERSNGKR